MPSSIVQAGEVRTARVESVRALAALGVVAGHAWGISHAYGAIVYTGYGHVLLLIGGVGVWVFFTLSGYLLFWPFVRHYFGSGEPVSLSGYARNRAYRILPLYYAAVVVLLILSARGGSTEQWWRFLLFAESYSPHTVITVDPPLWSVIVELQFYVLLPVGAALLAWCTRRRVRPALLLLGAFALLSIALRHWAVHHHPGSRLWAYSLPATVFFFTPGLLLAVVRLRWEQGLPRWLRGCAQRSSWWIVAAVLILLLEPVIWTHEDEDAVALAALLLVGACVLPLRTGTLLRALDWRPLAAIGVVSYSLYVWHYPLLQLVNDRFGGRYPVVLVGGTLLSLGVAAVSYAVIERPFLRLRTRWSSVSPALTTPASDPVDESDPANGSPGPESQRSAI